MRESRTCGSERGAPSNGRPYREKPTCHRKSNAYRAGRNAQQAAVEVEELLFRGHPEVVDADLADYLEAASYCPPAYEVRSNSVG